MGADYTVGGLFVNWPIRAINRMRPIFAFRFRGGAAIVQRGKSF
jgi:hypothetical protein